MQRSPKLELYPIRFKEIYRRKPWGGDLLKKTLGKKGAPSNTGESIEIILSERYSSVAASGPFKGVSLNRIIQKYPREILGDDQSMRFRDFFPVVVKFLNAKDRLSLQVHPSDDFAQRYENSGRGKSEMWYILSSTPESRVIRGVLPGTTIAEFKKHLSAGTIEQCLNTMDVREGDIIFIPPGTIHTAYGDVVILEIQQNSDITYRISDWNRPDLNGRPRKLDLDKAMGVIDFYSMGVSKYKPMRILGYAYKRKLLLKCEKFTAELIDIQRKRIKEKAHRDRFHILTIIAGTGTFYYGDKKKTDFRTGETYLMPAHLGDYEISSKGICKIVYTYVS